MCTVSYIPLKDGYILTSNRDENPLRHTIHPVNHQLKNGETLIAPLDAEKRGTWIATNTKNKTACLLNGAYEKHQRSLPYKRSRGHYVIESFMFPTFLNYVEAVDLHNIEPFTLLFMEEDLQSLVWDGYEKHYTILDKTTPQLWSSCTLYTKEAHRKKMLFFQENLRLDSGDKTEILHIHGLYKKTPFTLDHSYIKTVSIAQIISKNNHISLDYYPIK